MALGIVLGRFASSWLFLFALCLMAVSLLVITVLSRELLRKAWFPVTMLALGSVLMFSQVCSVTNGKLPELAARKTFVGLAGRVVSTPVNTGESSSFFLQAEALALQGHEYACGERALVRVDGSIDVEKYYCGSVVIARGTLLTGTNSAGWLLDHGAASILKVTEKNLKGAPVAPDPVSMTVHRARHWFSVRYRHDLPSGVAGLMEGMTIGTVDRIEPGVMANLRACGLSHIVSVAGLHVGSVALVVLGVLAAAGAGRKGRYVCACLAAALVLALSNFKPSTMRASIMAAIAFGGAMTGRDYDPLAGLSIAGVIIVALNPRSLFDSTFQYSFVAACGIVLAVRGLKASGFRTFIAVCAGTQLAIIPLMLFRGDAVPVTAIAANALVIPLIGPLLVSGWGLAILGGACAPAATVLAIPIRFACRYVVAVASFFSAVPKAGIFGTTAGVLSVVIYLYALATIILRVRSGGALFKPAVAFMVAVMLALVPCTPIAAFSSSNRVTVLDVGEGDAILVQDRSGASVLVDGGPDGRLLMKKLEALNVRKLDAIVSSHPHADHEAGLITVLQQLPVGRLIDPGLPKMSGLYRTMIQVAESKGVKRTIAREGQVFRVSSSTELDVLYAPLDLEKIPEDVNDCSLVVMARVAGMRALLSGDIGPKAEDTLLGRHPNLECDLLKIPHQGAREAASARFYEACDPAVAAISVGRDNMYGHPAHECLELLASRGIRVARTDTDGDISLSVDNGRIGLVKARR